MALANFFIHDEKLLCNGVIRFACGQTESALAIAGVDLIPDPLLRAAFGAWMVVVRWSDGRETNQGWEELGRHAPPLLVVRRLAILPGGRQAANRSVQVFAVIPEDSFVCIVGP